jgi:hypothetical protein
MLSRETREVRGKLLFNQNKEFRKAHSKKRKDDKLVLVEVAAKLLGKSQVVLVELR